MTTLDIEALHATLDDDPSDQLTRRVLADAYEDAGDAVMADGLRWMAEMGVWPQGGCPVEDGVEEWAWWRLSAGGVARTAPEENAQLLLAERNALVSRHDCTADLYATRRAAEEALCRALASMPRRP